MDNYKNHEYSIDWEKKHYLKKNILEYLFWNRMYVFYIYILFLAFPKQEVSASTEEIVQWSFVMIITLLYLMAK